MRCESTDLAVILGSGLHDARGGMSTETVVEFSDIPGLMKSEIEGHRGKIVRAAHGAKNCLLVLGRKHHYEGANGEIRALMQYLKKMGVCRLLLTSASGSLNPMIEPGDLVLVSNVVDLQFRTPLFPVIAGNKWSAGVPDDLRTRTSGLPGGPVGRLMRGFSGALSASLQEALREAAEEAVIPLKRGVLASMTGPSYETKAEVEALRRFGADLVTMSAAPEIELAGALGMEVAVVAVVSNFATGLSSGTLSHEEVLRTGTGAGGSLGRLIRQVVANS